MSSLVVVLCCLRYGVRGERSECVVFAFAFVVIDGACLLVIVIAESALSLFSVRDGQRLRTLAPLRCMDVRLLRVDHQQEHIVVGVDKG